jgi:hypothetical protein
MPKLTKPPKSVLRENLGLSQAALDIRRGVTRYLNMQNIACIAEVPLPNKRRADLVAILKNGTIWIIEIKSGVADFKADNKWHEYKDYCDAFYFAVDADFPEALLPTDIGYIRADAFSADIIRTANHHKLSAARRSAIMRKFARTAAFRLTHHVEPKLKTGVLFPPDE